MLRPIRLHAILTILCLCSPVAGAAAGQRTPVRAAAALAERMLGAEAARQFVFEVVPAAAPDRRTFSIESTRGKIRITGEDTLALAAGLHGYLKEVTKAHVSWCHDRLQLPKVLPRPKTRLVRTTRELHGSAFNYCTFNYTMAWWNAARWERELDLLAMLGIDRPLAILGSEAIWMNVLQRFGFTAEEARATLCGPAYTAWWLMGNIEGVGGPVSDATIQARVALQRRILARMRELGMRPVFQGFVGLVPASLGRMFPSAKLIPQGQWCGLERPPVLHPEDPLFDRLAKAWYEEVEKLFGPADLFAGDLFHEGGNPGGVDVAAMAVKVQNLMRAHRPGAVWSIQGWSGNPTPELLSVLENRHTEVVELCNEFFRNWEPSKGFSGKPWTFGTIIQYGGNVGLHGRLPALVRNFEDARASSNPPAGIGFLWEGTEVNPVVADLLADIRWREGRTEPDAWLGDYAARRYGLDSPRGRRAWSLLLQTAYGEFEGARRPTESIFCARPGPAVKKVSPFSGSVEVRYDLRQLRDAILLMLEEAPSLGRRATYRHDLVDFARQFLAGVGLSVYREALAADAASEAAVYQRAAAEFLELLDFQDTLLGSDQHFLLGKWLASAPAGEADAYEEQARALVTTWYLDRKPAVLSDYAWREWNGLLRTFYRPRWEAWFAHRRSVLAGGAPLPAQKWEELEVPWTKLTLPKDPHPSRPVGDAVALVREAMRRWGAFPDNAARYRPPVVPVPAAREAAANAR